MLVAEDDKMCCVALAEAGIRVNSVYDLLRSKIDYSKAIPVLLKLLKLTKTPNIKEGIIRALAVKSARGLVENVLIDEFLELPNSGYSLELKWTIGNTLYVLGTIDSHFDKVAKLILDPDHGPSRQMLVMLLGKTKKNKESSEDLALESLKDNDLQGHAIHALGNLRAVKASSVIEEFLSSSNAWHQREARAALKKIQKSTKT